MIGGAPICGGAGLAIGLGSGSKNAGLIAPKAGLVGAAMGAMVADRNLGSSSAR